MPGPGPDLLLLVDASSPLILGTRGSALAMAQTHLTLAALREAVPAGRFEVREIKTTGDKRQDLSLTRLAPGGHGYDPDALARESDTPAPVFEPPVSQPPSGPLPGRVDPGLFTKELEAELLAGSISVAVHSLKDLPTVMPDGLKLAAVLPRADVSDVLILKPSLGGSLRALPAGAMLATSSLRRQRQLLWHRPDLHMSEVRGNVGTRLRKLLAHDGWAGLILAHAGLARLGYAEALRTGTLEAEGGRFEVEVLGPDTMLPAVGQGAIGLQARADDAHTLAVLSAVNHAPTWQAIIAERELLRLLGGGCQLPLGISTRIDPARERLHLRAVLFTMSGEEPPVFGEEEGPLSAPEFVAGGLAKRLLAPGR